jgi:hypothetical protein
MSEQPKPFAHLKYIIVTGTNHQSLNINICNVPVCTAHPVLRRYKQPVRAKVQ